MNESNQKPITWEAVLQFDDDYFANKFSYVDNEGNIIKLRYGQAFLNKFVRYAPNADLFYEKDTDKCRNMIYSLYMVDTEQKE